MKRLTPFVPVYMNFVVDYTNAATLVLSKMAQSLLKEAEKGPEDDSKKDSEDVSKKE